MMKQTRHKIMSILTLSLSASALADTLPKGIGSIVIGGRAYVGDPTYYDSTGKVGPLSSRLDKNFSSESMRTGAGGEDLRKLYDNVKKFDSAQNSAGASIADELSLGKQVGIVDAKIDGKFFGLAYGVTDSLTLYTGLTFVSASIDADIRFEGYNNALDIKNRLGDAAFDELKSGLDKAARVNRETILNAIHNEYHYKNIHHWKYQGQGDSVFGVRTGWNHRASPSSPKYSLDLSAQLNIPTGPAYDADALVQAPISREYYSLDLLSEHKLTWTYVAIGSEIGLGKGMTKPVTRRVPEHDETLVASERKTGVTLNPGIDTKLSAFAIAGKSSYRGQYKIGFTKHSQDSIKGSIPGNYGLLESRSSNQEIYHEVALVYSTIKSYRQKRSAIPLMATLSLHDTITAVNNAGQRSIELTLLTFFATPSRENNAR